MSMEEAISSLIDSIAEKAPKAENTYMGADGLLYCSKCNQKTETIIKHPFTGEERKVPCRCGCRTEMDDFKDRQKQEENERRRNFLYVFRNKARCLHRSNDSLGKGKIRS